MKPRHWLAYILTAVTSLPFIGNVAPAATIEIIQTFDYPGEGLSTLAEKVSDQGVVVGTTIDANGVARGFLYKLRLHKFSALYAAPRGSGNQTYGRGINNRRHTCGEYLDKNDGTFHGYLVQYPDLLEFDVPGAIDTFPLGINNVGDLAGSVILEDDTQPAFVSLRGTITLFAVPDATATFAYQLNATNDIIGYYLDGTGIAHGYTRDPSGNLTFPIDVPGASATFLLGNNDSNWGVGRYTDESGATHGLFFLTSTEIQSYDYPGATYTSLTGINKDGFICGYYFDEAGIGHSFEAKLNLAATTAPNTVAPARPAKLPLEMYKTRAPAL
jgi:hypothetical protein